MHVHACVPRQERYLRWSLAITTLFVAAEAVAGLQSGSLALLSDAGHNFTDALALLLAALAIYFQAKPANEVKTYGYHRAGVLAAFVNALTMLLLSALIFYESWHRIQKPEPVNEATMLIVATLGLGVNALIMWWLRQDRKHDLNIRAAFLHMLGDALGSVGIIVGAIVIRSTGWLWVDAVLSILIAGLIVWSARSVVKESLNILLEGLPHGMKLDAVVGAIRGVDGVVDVHDVHVWSLGSSTHALSCHVQIEDLPPSASEAILRRINDMVCERFRIHHTTIQFEHAGCAVSAHGCVIPAGAHSHP
ncbi:MAG: cation diffusion facilitator family transporter [Longimicrobiales bacterium]